MNIEVMNIFGEDAQFAHVGVAIDSIDSVLQGTDKVTDSIQRAVVSFIHVHGLKIELVEPKNIHSPVSNMLRKGCQIVYIAFSVPDIRAAVQNARKTFVALDCSAILCRGL